MTPTVSAPPSPGTSPTGTTSDWPATSGGPFADRTGGLITFQADDDQQAQHAVDTDPFVQEGLLKAHWLKQWTPE
jgi:hypothetical protein